VPRSARRSSGARFCHADQGTIRQIPERPSRSLYEFERLFVAGARAWPACTLAAVSPCARPEWPRSACSVQVPRRLHLLHFARMRHIPAASGWRPCRNAPATATTAATARDAEPAHQLSPGLPGRLLCRHEALGAGVMGQCWRGPCAGCLVSPLAGHLIRRRHARIPCCSSLAAGLPRATRRLDRSARVTIPGRTRAFAVIGHLIPIPLQERNGCPFICACALASSIIIPDCRNQPCQRQSRPRVPTQVELTARGLAARPAVP